MKRVMAIVQDPEYIPLLGEHGVIAISAPWATAAMVESYLDRPGVAELFEIGSGVAGLVSVLIPEGAAVDGSQIQEIGLPRECVVAAVIRGEEFLVPRGDTVVSAGDYIVVVGPESAIKKANELFVARR